MNGSADFSRLVFNARNLARVLMVEDPPSGEWADNVFMNPELQRMFEIGHGVAHSAGTGEEAYISIRDGLRTASSKRPEWADPAQIIEVIAPLHSDLVHKRFIGAVKELEVANAEAVTALGLTKAAEIIAPYYGASTKRSDLWDIEEAVALSEIGAHELLSSTTITPSGSLQVANDAASRHLGLEMVGFAARPVVALFALLANMPELIGPLMAAAGEWSDVHIKEGGGDIPPGASVLLAPSDLDTWSAILNSITGGRAWQMFVITAEIIIRFADRKRDEALASLTFEDFNFHLCSSLLQYESAKLLYEQYQRSPDGQFQERASKACLLVDEMNARIRTALQWSVGLTIGPNFSDPGSLHDWISSLTELPFAEARLEISDLSSQLVFPNIVRDLAIARLEQLYNRESGRRRASRALDRLNADRDRMVMLDGGAFLSFAHAVLDAF